MGISLSCKIHQKIIVGFFSFLSAQVFAEKLSYCSVYNAAPKYTEQSKHTDYINPDAPKGGALKFPVIGTFDGLNPFVVMGSNPAYINLFCFAKLFDESQDEIGMSYPCIAKNVDISDDRKTITFELMEKALFSDGTPITAEDVVWSFNFLIKINPIMSNYYKDIEKVEAVDTHTVRFYSKNPQNKELALILGQLAIFHSKFFKQNSSEEGNIRIIFPVSGPYKLATADFGRTLVFERVKNWWGEKLPQNVGMNNFEKIELYYFRDRVAAFQSFLAGDTNFWIESQSTKWHTAYDIDQVKQGKIIKKVLPDTSRLATRGFAFNLRRAKFQDIRVRKAISLLLNFESLNKAAFYNEYTRNNSYYGGELSHVDVPQGEELKLLEPHKDKLPIEVFGPAFRNSVYQEDILPRAVLQEVLELLKASGWELEDQKLVHKDGEVGEVFEIIFPYSDASMEKIILHLQRNLAAAGIHLIPKQVDASTYTEMIDQFDFDMAMLVIGQSHTLGNEQREFFSSRSANIKGSKNLPGIENPIVDELIEKLIVAKDYQTMVDCAHAIDRVLCWNYYIVLNWDFSALRAAYWNIFGMPEQSPKYSPFPMLTWWQKPDAVQPKQPEEEKTKNDKGFVKKTFEQIKGLFS